MNLKQLRKQVVGAIGPQAHHALQDGFTLMVLFGLSVTAPVLVAVLGFGLGLDGAVGPKKILKKADTFLRTEDIQANPEYFVLGSLVGVGVGLGVGTLTAPYLPALGAIL